MLECRDEGGNGCVGGGGPSRLLIEPAPPKLPAGPPSSGEPATDDGGICAPGGSCIFAGEFGAPGGGGRPDPDLPCIPGNGEAFGGAGDIRLLPLAGDGDPTICFGPNGLSLDACGCCV